MSKWRRLPWSSARFRAWASGDLRSWIGGKYHDHAKRYQPVRPGGRHGLALAELNLGGGHAVPYAAGDEDFDLASSYNMVGRPPVVAVRDGAARLLVRRETESDLLRRDIGS